MHGTKYIRAETCFAASSSSCFAPDDQRMTVGNSVMNKSKPNTMPQAAVQWRLLLTSESGKLGSNFSPHPSEDKAQPEHHQQAIHDIDATTEPMPQAKGGQLLGQNTSGLHSMTAV